jgi:hypothetical protein
MGSRFQSSIAGYPSALGLAEAMVPMGRGSL